MSCTTLMHQPIYQPYAMSYSSSACDRTSSAERQKLLKFPHVPSPPDSSNSAAGSPIGITGYSSSNNGHSLSLSTGNNFTAAANHHSSSSSGSATNFSLPLIPPPPPLTAGPGAAFNYHHHHPHHSYNLHHHHHQSLPLSPHETSPISQRSSSSTNSNSRRSLTPSCSVGPSATITSSHGESGGRNDLELPHTITSGSSSTSASSSSQSNSHLHQHTSSSSSSSNNNQQQSRSSRAQYLSANCVVYENYEGDSSSEVDEHFSKALSGSYSSSSNTQSNSGHSEKSSGKTPMAARNFPPSFWDSAYQKAPTLQTARTLTGYGASDFYGSAMDYASGGIALHHHHQTDPWHHPYNPLASHHHHHHQSYAHHHHRELAAAAYTPIPSTSRFNPAQYSSFLFPSTAAASSAASRFSAGIGSSGVKGDGHWGAGGRYHPHESSWSDFHLADYSAAAAHYSNIAAAGAASGNF